MLNTQQYKVSIKVNVEEFGVVATEKGAFLSPSSTFANFFK